MVTPFLLVIAGAECNRQMSIISYNLGGGDTFFHGGVEIMKGMKKFLSIVLVGAMVIGSCSCNKKDSRRSDRDDDDDRDQRSETTDDADVKDKDNDEISTSDYYWYFDPTDEKTMRRLVDSIIACEPRVGDVCITNERDDFAERVWDGFDHKYSSCYGYSSQGEFVFEYGNYDDYLSVREDRIGLISYSGYAKKDIGAGLFDFEITGYDEAYLHEYRPGSGCAAMYIYDEARAEKCKQILIDYLSELYKDQIIRTEDLGIVGFVLCYGEKSTDYVANVRLIQLRDDDHNPIDVWFIDLCITFNTPALMSPDVIAESERDATAPSTVSTTTSAYDDDDDWEDDDDDDEDDDDWDDDYWDDDDDSDDDDDDWDDDWDF